MQREFEAYVLKSSEWIEILRSKLMVIPGVVSVELMQSWNEQIKKHQNSFKLNIIICKPCALKQFLIQYPTYENKIIDYQWSTFPYPRTTMNETTDLHLKGFPTDLNLHQIYKIIYQGLDQIIPRSSYNIRFAIQDRHMGTTKGHGCIIFDSDVNIDSIYLAKLVFHHKPVTSTRGETRRITATWHRLRPDEKTVVMTKSKDDIEYKIAEDMNTTEVNYEEC
jgi:hypothetical protein